jgi:HAD superfamily hydrolase (TIGR01509 family)
MSLVHGVLFDIDGTLVDSNFAHAESWAKVLKSAGYDVQTADVLPLIGMGGDKLLPRLTGQSAESPVGRQLSKARTEMFLKRYLPSLRPTRGAMQLLQFLHSQGVRLAAATSATGPERDGLLRICGGDTVFEVATTADDAERSKPDPDIIDAALRQSGLTPGECVFVGATPFDIEAGYQAGLRVIALRCGGRSDDELAGAYAVFDHPLDLLEQYEQSPLVDSVAVMPGRT